MSGPQYIRVLVACERSGIVREAFSQRGFDAWSCDLEPADDGSRFHIHGDAIAATYGQRWDLMIAHPECTFLANSGAKHLYAGMKAENGPNADRWALMGAAAQFFLALYNAPIPHIAVENPIMLGHPKRLFGIPDPTQIIQPYEHGHGETKATGLWLRNLPTIVPSNPVEGREQRIWKMGPGPDRKKDRSRTYEGIAQALASQWGDYLLNQQRQAPMTEAEREREKERAAIVAWLLDDAAKTRADLTRLHSRRALTMQQTAQWETMVLTKTGIADAIERGDHHRPSLGTEGDG